jgi:CheY-like chemotaxis protein
VKSEDKMSKKILVVDDDEDSRTLLKTYFEADGFDVSLAEDGHDAVEKALKMHPDLIVIDMAMPLVDGVNSVKAMRQHDELVSTPIIALTGFGDFYAPRALKAGCDAVSTKPVDFTTLAPLVQRHLAP